MKHDDKRRDNLKKVEEEDTSREVGLMTARWQRTPSQSKR
jgi:hypothetical protein